MTRARIDNSSCRTRHSVISRRMLNFLCLVSFLIGIIWIFLPQGDSPGSRSISEFWNIGHIILFFLACHLLYAFRPQFAQRSLFQQAATVIGATLLVGGGIELLQILIPSRTSSFSDLLANFSGTLAYLSFRHREKTGKYLLLHLAALSLIGFLIWPPTRSFIDENTARRQFPLLAGFETFFETDRFEGKASRFYISREKAFQGKFSLRLDLTTQQHSGIWLRFMPQNWREFSYLGFTVYNPQQKQIPLHVIVNDEHNWSDRYDGIFPLETGWNVVEIPLPEMQNAPHARQLDLTRIRRLGIYVVESPEPLRLYLDDIRLK